MLVKSFVEKEERKKEKEDDEIQFFWWSISQLPRTQRYVCEAGSIILSACLVGGL